MTKAPEDTDIIFLGDINAKLGRTKDTVEQLVIGRYGEPNSKRNFGGEYAMNML